MHLLVTRSAADAASLEGELARMGHDTSSSPLIEIEPLACTVDLTGGQGLVVTSRNALKCLGRENAAKALHLPLFAVGPATGALAREMGFTDVIEGPAAARDLPALISARTKPDAGPLIHISGEDQAFDMKGALQALGFDLKQALVYRAVAVKSLDPQVFRDIQSGKIEGVVLMSPRTATIFSDLALKAGIVEPASRLTYFCLSGAVAKALAKIEPLTIKVASLPNLQEMLALLAREAPSSQ